MNREIMISIMKTGIRTIFGTDVFISFGQWSHEMQKLAKEIGPESFEVQHVHGKYWSKCSNTEIFNGGYTYRLRSDWQDKPKEPEYEYLEIVQDMQNGRSVYAISGAGGMFASDALCYVGFHKYCDSEKKIFQDKFSPAMKYVVIKKS